MLKIDEEDESMVMDNVGVMDDVGKEIAEEQKKSYIRQIDGFKDNLKQVQEAKDNYEKQWKVDDELYSIILKGQKKLIPVFEYENDSRYWELRDMQGQFKYRQDKHLAESKIDGYNKQIESIQTEITKLEDGLRKLEGD